MFELSKKETPPKYIPHYSNVMFPFLFKRTHNLKLLHSWLIFLKCNCTLFKGKGSEKSREKTTEIKVSTVRENWKDEEKDQVARTTEEANDSLLFVDE